MIRSLVIVSTYALLLLVMGCATEKPKLGTTQQDLNDLTERDYAEVEKRLSPLAAPLPKPGPGDWLAQHKEAGQTFAQYLRAKPVRKSETRSRIFLCLIGDFSPEQEQVLKITGEYLQAFYQMPVEVHEKLPLDKIPEHARRTHPSWGDKQILSTYVFDDVLEPHRPTNALAYIAFTSSDLWPGEGWNFVFGQASLSERVGVWPIYRNGDPAKSPEDFSALPDANDENRLARNRPHPWHAALHRVSLQHERQQQPRGIGSRPTAPVPGLFAEGVLEFAGRAGEVFGGTGGILRAARTSGGGEVVPGGGWGTEKVTARRLTSVLDATPAGC